MEVTVNGRPRVVSEGATVAALLDELDLAKRHVAVEVNCELVSRREHAGHRLAEGDQIEIVTLVGGG